ncbi:MAG: hypothetical protein FWG83_03940 [Oscillospiraceae bacterium]|nr:hypothetical protein [Oscillospiraceae bacterium]
MQKSRINQLLEEISAEILKEENRNRGLYASAVDIEDEELSLKIQAESFRALRNMRGLKSAMEDFRYRLEQSGILGATVSDELPEPQILPESKTESQNVVLISHEHGPIIVPNYSLNETKVEEPEIQEEIQEDFDEEIEEEPEEEIQEETEEDFSEEEEEEEEAAEPPQYTPQTEETPQPIFTDYSDFEAHLGAMNPAIKTAPVPANPEGENIGNIETIVEELKKNIHEINDSDFIISNDLDESAEQDGQELQDLDEELDELADELNELSDLNELGDLNDLNEDASDDFNFDFDSDISFDEIRFEEPTSKPGTPPSYVSPADLQKVELPEEKSPEKEEHEDDFSGFGMNPPEVGIYSGRTPARFVMFGRNIEVANWGDMLAKVCEILILKNPYTVAQFDKYHDLNPLGSCYFSYNQGEIKDVAKKLSNGLWVETNRSADDIVMLCKKILELCGYPRSELEIEFLD